MQHQSPFSGKTLGRVEQPIRCGYKVDECRVRLDSQQVSVKSVLLNRGGYSYLTGPAVPLSLIHIFCPA